MQVGRSIPWRRLWPLAALAGGLALFFALGLHKHISMEALRANHDALQGWRAAHPWLAAGVFLLVTTALMAMAFPSVGVLMFAGGLIFGLWQGLLLSLLGATAGGFILFLAARNAREAALDTRLGPMLEWMARGSSRSGFFYLLSLRLMPIIPTVAATLAAAAARIKARDFVLATLLGPLPVSFVFTGLGAGAREFIEAGQTQDIAGALLRPIVIGPLLALAALSMIAAWLRHRAPQQASKAD